MRPPLLFTAVISILLGSPAFSQRHLPDLQIFQSTVNVYVDTQIEKPAVNQGISVAGLPRQGELLSFQLFVPTAANQSLFEYTIALLNPNDAVTSVFQIVSVTDWKEREIPALSGAVEPPGPPSGSSGKTCLAPDTLPL